MAVKQIWGSGYVRFEHLMLGVCEFKAKSNAKVFYQEIKTKKTNINNEIITKKKGYRIKISVELYNVKTGDSEEFQKLINMVNDSFPVTIYPFYHEDEGALIADNLKIDNCILDSDFSMEDLTGKGYFQRVKLTFIKKDLVDVIPKNVNYIEYQQFIDNNDNMIITETGDSIIFKDY